MTCGTPCKHWAPVQDIENPTRGECRALAPRAGRIDLRTDRPWPLTEAADGCGAFEPDAEPKKGRGK